MAPKHIYKEVFGKLKDVSVSLENEVRYTEDEMLKPKRELPERISILAVENISEEVDSIKKYVEATLIELQNCIESGRNTVLLATNAAKELEEGIARAEKLLEQFGYQPTEDVEEKKISSPVETCIPPCTGIPETAVGLECHELEKQEALALKNLSSTLFTPNACVTSQVHTPVRKKYIPFTPIRTPACFLSEVTVTPGLFQNNNLKAEPGISSTRDGNLVERKLSTPEKPKCKSLYWNKPQNRKLSTPEEPILMSVQKTKPQARKIITPEEPILKSVGKKVMVGKYNSPEEPILQSVEKRGKRILNTPEKPIWKSSYRSKPQTRKSNTPEEPIPQSVEETVKIMSDTPEKHIWKTLYRSKPQTTKFNTLDEPVLRSVEKTVTWKVTPEETILQSAPRSKIEDRKITYKNSILKSAQKESFQDRRWKPMESILKSSQNDNFQHWIIAPKESILKSAQKENFGQRCQRKLEFRHLTNYTPEAPTFKALSSKYKPMV